MGDNAFGAGNQQATSDAYRRESSETIRQTPLAKSEILAYLHGALHDASLNKGKRIRFVQKYREWLELLQKLLAQIGYRSWIYREGKKRNLYTLETLCKELHFDFNPLSLESPEEQIMYLRGFFDAEGGVPRKTGRFYIQLVQKDYGKIGMIKNLLGNLGIEGGKIHNPSWRVDPNYWRIFVLQKHHALFARIIGSWHPIKSQIFRERMKI